MERETRKTTSKAKENDAKNAIRRRAVKIDVQCKQYKMLFPSDFNPAPAPATKAVAVRERATRSKSKTAEGTPVTAKVAKEKPVSAAPSGTKTTAKRKGVKLSRTKSEALGALNVNNSSTLKTSSSETKDAKREKRKRHIVDDTEIAAENIPLEAVLPALQFGINKDICPKKRRRLQSLISPRSPNKKFPFV